MNKWIAIPVIAVLAVAVVVVGFFLWQQTSKLGEARSEIAALEGNVATIEGNISTLEGEISTLETELAESEATVSTLEATVATLEGEISTLETELAESEATVSTLEANLETANNEIRNLQADVKTQQTLNLALSEELKKVKYPRHFESLVELVDWLQKDDTDTRYAGEDILRQSFILQVRALRDGYLLPVSYYVQDGVAYIVNWVIIGDSIYTVWASDDYVEWYTYTMPIPSRPIPLD